MTVAEMQIQPYIPCPLGKEATRSSQQQSQDTKFGFHRQLETQKNTFFLESHCSNLVGSWTHLTSCLLHHELYFLMRDWG